MFKFPCLSMAGSPDVGSEVSRKSHDVLGHYCKFTLSFIDIGKSCLNREFFTSLMCLLMLFVKNKIFAKISESKVIILSFIKKP